jgi:pimeloyl-ACP methyl ester carboxylesterase
VSTLVLLPGLAADAAMWRHQVAALARWQPQVSDVHMRHASIQEMAAALLARYPGPLVLCGASMGGIVAMEVVRQAPDRVQGLALLGTNAQPESDEMRALRQKAIVLFAQGQVEEVIRPNAGLAFHADDPALHAEYVNLVLRAGAEQLIRQNRAIIERPDARLHLPRVRCPTLVVCGEDDQLTPLPLSREIAGLVPAAELVVLPHCGHMLTMEQPEAVNAVLREWLGRLPA